MLKEVQNFEVKTINSALTAIKINGVLLTENDDLPEEAKLLKDDGISRQNFRMKNFKKKNKSKFRDDLHDCVKFLDTSNIFYNINGISKSLLKNR